jgi:hypothetical protein
MRGLLDQELAGQRAGPIKRARPAEGKIFANPQGRDARFGGAHRPAKTAGLFFPGNLVEPDDRVAPSDESPPPDPQVSTNPCDEPLRVRLFGEQPVVRGSTTDRLGLKLPVHTLLWLQLKTVDLDFSKLGASVNRGMAIRTRDPAGSGTGKV